MTNTSHIPTFTDADQVYFVEFTRWKPGQHFITTMRTLDEGKVKQVVARVHLELDENRKATYIAKDSSGTEFLRSNNIIELKKQLKEYGKTLEATPALGEQKEQAGQATEVGTSTPPETKSEITKTQKRKQSQEKGNTQSR